MIVCLLKHSLFIVNSFKVYKVYNSIQSNKYIVSYLIKILGYITSNIPECSFIDH